MEDYFLELFFCVDGRREFGALASARGLPSRPQRLCSPKGLCADEKTKSFTHLRLLQLPRAHGSHLAIFFSVANLFPIIISHLQS